jgi:hypothetical protein
MQRESDLNFSSGLTILPGLSFKSGIKSRNKKNEEFYFIFIIIDVSIAAVCFCQDQPEQIAVFYEPVCLKCFFFIKLIFVI